MTDLDLKGLDLKKIQELFSKFKFKTKSNCVGIDVSSNNVKLVQLERKKNRILLKNYAVARVDYSLMDFEKNNSYAVNKAVGVIIKKILNKNNIKTKDINLAIPSFTALVTVFDIHNVSNKVDMESLVKIEAEKYIPVPLEDVVYDWQLVEEEEENQFKDKSKEEKLKEMKNEFKKDGVKEELSSNKKRIILVAIMKDVSYQYERAIERAGLNINSLEISSLSLIRSLIGKDKKNYIILDIGDNVCDVNFVVRGNLVLHKNNDFAGNKLTKSLQRVLNVEKEKAEALKIEKGLSLDVEDAKRLVFEPFLNSLIGEIIESQKVFEENYPKEKIESIILSGGSAYLKGLKEELEKKFGINVYLGNPWARIEYPKKVEKYLLRLGPSLAVAVGLAMMDLE